jgi:hypothetical protein
LTCTYGNDIIMMTPEGNERDRTIRRETLVSQKGARHHHGFGY